MVTEREGPRANGIMQNVQRWSQPCCTCMKARLRPSKPGTRWPASCSTDMMSSTRILPSRGMTKFAPCSFSRLPRTRSTSSMAANAAGSNCAAAACHHDGRPWPLPACLPDGLTSLTHRLIGHRAGVNDDRIVQARTFRLVPHHLSLIGIQAAAKIYNLQFPHATDLDPGCVPARVAGPIRLSSITPEKAVAAGPVIRTWPSPARHSTVKAPPSRFSLARRPHLPRR